MGKSLTNIEVREVEAQLLSPFTAIYDEITIHKMAYQSFLQKQSNYSEEFKQEQRRKYIDNVRKTIQEAADKTRGNIDSYREELTTIKMEQPPEVQGEDIKQDTLDMILYELKRQNDFNTFSTLIRTANTAEAIGVLYEKHKTNPTFKILFDEELQSKINGTEMTVASQYARLNAALSAEPAEFSVFERIKHQLVFFSNNELIPVGIENGLDQIKMVSIWDDLESKKPNTVLLSS